MNTDMVIVCFCGSCAWATVGFLMNDMCITLPNRFGIVIGGLQVHLIVKFTEAGLWNKSGTDDTASLLRNLEGGSEKACERGEYEASVYKRAKVFVLLAVAHVRFVLENYAHFATSTLGEVLSYASESQLLRGEGTCHCWSHGGFWKVDRVVQWDS